MTTSHSDRRAVPGPHPRWRVALRVAALVVLVVLAILRSALGTALDSFTVDEPWHVVAGTTYARTGDFSLNPEHPPLVKRWVGATMPASFQLRPVTVLSEKAQEREWVEQTMFVDNDPVQAQASARLSMWALNGLQLLALGLLLWRACGWPWAAGALAVLALEPTVGAHLPVVMTDLPLALTLAIAGVAAGLLASTWRWRWVVLCGVALGLALGAKHSAHAGIAGIGLVLLLALAAGWRGAGPRVMARRALQLLACGTLAVVVLWAQYDFQFHAGVDGSDGFNRPMPDKIAELNLPGWRAGIAWADRWQLLPRAYLWGLADTVRTGVEGRAQGEHFVWGRFHAGAPPWFSWPAIAIAKTPLALLALALLGALLLWRAPLPSSARWAGLALLAACAFHMLALVGSGGIWGGVRHAMPVMVGIALLAGAALALAWQRRGPALRLASLGLLLVALAMTIREPRLWEYHNELVGGSPGAYRFFANEGVDLGQRFAEVRAFHDRVIAAGDLPLYADYWVGETQIRAAGLRHRRRVESLDDDNVEGIYDGWFLYTMSSTLPRPTWDWDPVEVFAELEPVARFGYVGIWKGRVRRPQSRAGSMNDKVMDYIYKQGGQDWALVARRLEEVVAWLPQQVDAAIELSNAHLRLGQREQAIAALRRLLEQDKMPVDAVVAAQASAQIERIGASPDLAGVEPLRNPWLE